ncbi:MAG: hypothetical protein J7K66_06920 [Anaerolineaceae bacterium]|nr:hypothetical protein [Anaerolineaceae bacterium]
MNTNANVTTGMTQINCQIFLEKNLSLPVYSAANINHKGETVVIPKYCHCDQKIFSLTVVAPASKIEAKLHIVKDSIKSANGEVPGLIRRFHAIAAVEKQSVAEITYAIVKPGN